MGRPTLASDSSSQATGALGLKAHTLAHTQLIPESPRPLAPRDTAAACPPLGTRKEEKDCLSPPTGALLTPPSKPTHQGLGGHHSSLTLRREDLAQAVLLAPPTPPQDFRTC